VFGEQENIDYLAELIVSHLLTVSGIDDANIYVHLMGIFKRFFSRDIEKTEVHKNDSGEEEWHIYLNREGIYDLLPEGYFHSHSNQYFKGRRETIEEFRLHKKEEKNARQLFMPLEQEFFYHLVQKEIFEQNYFYVPETIHEFIDFFNLEHLTLNMYQEASLFFILPHISKIAGNLELTETCFEIILQEQVKIKKIFEPLALDLDNEVPVLNKSILGVNTLVGNVCIDNNPQLQIEIGPLQDSNSLKDFLNGSKYKLINRLIELFIQADLGSRIKVYLNEQDTAFILGEKEYEGRINYSTTI